MAFPPKSKSPGHLASMAAIDKLGSLAKQFRSSRLKGKFPKPQAQAEEVDEAPSSGGLSDDEMAQVHEARKNRFSKMK